MPISNKLPDGLDEVDVIIAGGGCAACVVAGRLAEADPSLSVLVIEGGQDNYQNDNVINPGLFGEHLRPGSTTAIFYKAKGEKQLAGKERIVPAGGLLGGGSSINLMAYTRAQRSDFDSWKTPGWSANELIPFLKKFETYHGNGKPDTHGFDGPVHVSYGGYGCKRSEDDFIEASAAVGYPEYPDLQDLDSNNGVQRWLRFVSKDGQRQDSAHVFVHPRLRDGKHPNLHVLTESKVVKVLFDENKRAVGVEFSPNPDYQDESVPRPKGSIRASKLVVVSCGACGTPGVLERSGVGDKSVLEKAGVPVVDDLPGVGNDYQDHNLVFYPSRTNLELHETMDQVLRVKQVRDKMVSEKQALLGWNTCDVAMKIRPTEKEVDELGPEFRKAWNRDFRDAPDRPIMLLALISSFLADPASVPPGQYVSVAAYTAYPYSRGHIHITGPHWDDPLDFELGFFTDPGDCDLKKQIWAYKKHREIMRRTKLYRGELEVGHPKFPAGSKASCANYLDDSSYRGPASDIKDLEYSPADDEAIEQFLRENIQTTWHQLGTAKMAPRGQMGVVDSRLNVYGVEGLKLADLSICPENVAANTMNTALLVGEKAADIIISDLGLGETAVHGVNGGSTVNGMVKGSQ